MIILKRCNLKDSELPKYYALIMFDGDNMGKLLSGSELKDDVNLEEFHQLLA
jgi:CRISPR-associated protein Cmr2